MQNVVALEGVTKRYGAKVAVDAMTLAIAPGSMFGLLGPNGAGKTSAIRIITGVTLPDSGAVKLFGQPFARGSLRRVGYLPEERGLYRKMLVRDQLIFMGRLHGLSRATAASRAERWTQRLQIADALGKKTDELSKGMQQKIQFIATLMHEPEFIIMDEPFSGLDPLNALLLEQTLLELQRAGCSVLFSTHRMDQVERLCDSIALIDAGRVVLEGGMRDVKRRYPRERLLVAFEGGSPGLLDHAAVTAKREFAGHTELRLAPGADAQALLRRLVDSHATVLRWELQEPSLEEIFVRTVGAKTDA